ncbi:g-type lectin s-receptor-like serine/threonine-protein kinase sd1-13 [Quercus suber]|uniref:G-type lectin s-receptor-like serine/threonine-protein kinase sd1-13 n=1 Tax=Quercus suber TaxID=58331 RepID=A0AAW0KCD6_QUESU
MMKMSTNRITSNKVQFTSWKSLSVHPLEASRLVFKLLVFLKYSFGKMVAHIGAEWSMECCLLGFKPNNTEEWNRGNWTSGCVRSTPLQCEEVATGGEIGKMDGFLTLNMMKSQTLQIPHLFLNLIANSSAYRIALVQLTH